MNRHPTSRVSPQARHEASQWFVMLRESDIELATREAFYEWLRKAPENVHAFLRITALWEDAGLLAHSDLFDTERLLEKARAEPANVVDIGGGSEMAAQSLSRPLEKAGKWRAFRTPVAIAASVLLTVVSAWYWNTSIRNVYATGIGEQRTITLNDGSRIVLNSNSSARVRYADTQRNVDLLAGQAIFAVSHNPSRPFVVHTPTADIRAVGTEFDVYRKEQGTVVTVLEGSVAVRGAGSPTSDRPNPHSEAPPILVVAGQQVSIAKDHAETATPKPVDIPAATSWAQGKLIFNETPLSEVISEFNRYSSRKLRIEDPQLLSFHITGTFPTSDPIRIAELLQARFGVRIETVDDEIRVTR